MKTFRKAIYNFFTYVPFVNYGKAGGDLHVRYAPDDRRAFAQEIICRSCLVAAFVDGEDSAGRSKLRHMSPQEVVDFACDVSAKAFAEFESRGWLEELPDIDETFRMGRENVTISALADHVPPEDVATTRSDHE